MARQLITKSNDTWETIATGVAAFTIQSVGKGTLFMNETQDDDTANKYHPDKGNFQILQNEAVDTVVKVEGGDSNEPYEILVDGTL